MRKRETQWEDGAGSRFQRLTLVHAMRQMNNWKLKEEFYLLDLRVATKSQLEKLEVWCVVCVCAHVHMSVWTRKVEIHFNLLF